MHESRSLAQALITNNIFEHLDIGIVHAAACGRHQPFTRQYTQRLEMTHRGHPQMLDNFQVKRNLIAVVLMMLLVGCVRSETELLEAVESKFRSDPFIVAFRKSMERSFGCKFESDPAFQITSVYLSLYSVVGHQENEDDQRQAPTVHAIIYCHSAIVQRVYLDINLWRGNVYSFDQFTSIKPQMINRIRFEASDSFAWWISERRGTPSERVDPSIAAISTPIWSDFAARISAMFPQGCKPLDRLAVFFKDGQATIAPDVPFQEFSTVLSCPKPGPLKPGFSFRGIYFPTKGFVLPKEIETGGAYVD